MTFNREAEIGLLYNAGSIVEQPEALQIEDHTVEWRPIEVRYCGEAVQRWAPTHVYRDHETTEEGFGRWKLNIERVRGGSFSRSFADLKHGGIQPALDVALSELHDTLPLYVPSDKLRLPRRVCFRITRTLSGSIYIHCPYMTVNNKPLYKAFKAKGEGSVSQEQFNLAIREAVGLRIWIRHFIKSEGRKKFREDAIPTRYLSDISRAMAVPFMDIEDIKNGGDYWFSVSHPDVRDEFFESVLHTK